MGGHKIRPAEERDAQRLAELHIENLPDAFLSSLGKRFLGYLYGAMASSGDAVLLVAEDGGQVAGFVAGTVHLKRLYRHVLRRNIINMGALVFVRMFNPRTVRKVFETHTYSKRGEGALPAAELLAIGVQSGMRGRGLGGGLLDALKEEFVLRGVGEFRAVAGGSMAAARKLYENHGGTVAAEIEMHKGEKSLVYVWRI